MLSLSVLVAVLSSKYSFMGDGERSSQVPPRTTNSGGVLQLAGRVREALPEQILAQGRYLLGEFLDPSPAGLLVLGRIGFPAPEAGIEELAQATARRRVFAGYAGWGEGQLDSELAQGDWIAHPALPDDVFTEAPEELWSTVMARKGGSYVLIARMPTDPSMN